MDNYVNYVCKMPIYTLVYDPTMKYIVTHTLTAWCVYVKMIAAKVTTEELNKSISML